MYMKSRYVFKDSVRLIRPNFGGFHQNSMIFNKAKLLKVLQMQNMGYVMHALHRNKIAMPSLALLVFNCPQRNLLELKYNQ